MVGKARKAAKPQRKASSFPSFRQSGATRILSREAVTRPVFVFAPLRLRVSPSFSPEGRPLAWSIVPDQSGLEIEAKLLNRDVGFVVEGQEAEIKLDPFQYTKYGTIHGTVTWVSRDAVPDDKLGLLYPVRVALAKTSLDVGPRQVALGPGKSASVEIKTETRRVIEYLLSSLQRYRHETMRER